MAFFTGQSGAVFYGATAGSTTTQKVAKVRDWSMDGVVDLGETTSLGDFARTNTPTLKSATGSATIYYYTLEAGETGQFTAQTLLGKVIKTGAISDADRVTLELRVDTGRVIRFNAFINNAQVGSTTGEVTNATIQFTMDGDYLTTSAAV